APAIEPGDSFVAHFTPPRAGTFLYHAHIDEAKQDPAGLTGMLVVLEPTQRFDPSFDHLLFMTTPASGKADDFLINGKETQSWQWCAGETHHLRLANMTIGFPGG